MAKRTAERDLNHDNWDEEEEVEEAGSFKKAADSDLQKRVIRQAKRRLGAAAADDKPKAFAGFGGFSMFKPSSSETPNFSFITKPATENNTSTMTTTDVKKADQDTEYLGSIKQLNESVLSWIKEHVEKNPYCILTPVFKDYEQHVKSIEDKKQATASKNTTKTEDQPKSSMFSFGSNESGKPAFSFSAAPVSKTEPSKPAFSFSAATSSSTTEASVKPAFSFSSSPATGGSKPFSFGTTTTSAAPLFSLSSTTTSSPFSFGFASKPSEPAKKDEEEAGENGEEEEEPPKEEIKPVSEDDAFYSIRCKLFYKKDGNFHDKGVGTLFLKKTANGKTQLIVRADTSLGNILLNILLTDLPTQRVGKNNVMVVCIPNPPIDPKGQPAPTPMLIRVKTDKEADELLSKMNEAKQ